MIRQRQNLSTLTSEIACMQLRETGLRLSPADIQIERREDRWTVLLPDHRIAWFAANDRGHDRLAIERKVLRLLAQRCTFLAPRITYESALGFDVRVMVPGLYDPWGFYDRVKRDVRVAQKIGRAVGAILAQQHSRVMLTDVAGWLPERVAWPEPDEWIRERIETMSSMTSRLSLLSAGCSIYMGD